MRFFNQNGFTLAELLVYLMLAAVLFAGLTPVLSSSVQAWSVANRTVDAQQSARVVVGAISRELQFADSIVVPTDGQTANHLVFTLDEDHVPTTPSVSIGFQLGKTDGGNPNTVYRIKNAGVTPLTENLVSSLTFSRNGRKVDITVQMMDRATKAVLFTAKTTTVCLNIP